jgi:hypothetical protein
MARKLSNEETLFEIQELILNLHATVQLLQEESEYLKDSVEGLLRITTRQSARWTAVEKRLGRLEKPN